MISKNNMIFTKLEMLFYSETQVVTKLKNSKWVKTRKLKVLPLKHSNCDQTKKKSKGNNSKKLDVLYISTDSNSLKQTHIPYSCARS